MQLQSKREDFEKIGLQLVAISYDSKEILKSFATKQKIGYLLLSDPDSNVIDAYGIRNNEAKANAKLNGVPHPGTFLIDQKGRIQAKLGHEGYRERHTPEELLIAAKALKAK